MSQRITRRDFLLRGTLAGAALSIARSDASGAQEDLWKTVPPILARIKAPAFPSRAIDILKYGAKGDGITDCTQAFRLAIEACYAEGGGRVVVPQGRFVTGAIRLRSNIEVHVEEGGTIAFTRDPAAYLPLVPTRFEGVELMNYSPFIYALNETNIAITGRGTLDGQAGEQHWWDWRRTQAAARNRLLRMAADGVPVEKREFGDGPSRLRPNFVQPNRCRNVLIEGVTIVNSPMWELHPLMCTNVIVRDVTIDSHGPNNDGCDPESCRDVLIEKCTFSTGDDCIALKSGRNEDGRRLHTPIENVIIRDCDMRDGHGGVVIGSEITGGARNIFAENCRMDSPRLERVLRLKNNAARGGVIERVAMRDVTVGEVAEAIVAADFFYEEGRKGQHLPALRDVDVRHVTSRKSQYAFLLRGYQESPITNVRVSDCVFDGVQSPDVLEGVRDLVLQNVRINGARHDERIDR